MDSRMQTKSLPKTGNHIKTDFEFSFFLSGEERERLIFLWVSAMFLFDMERARGILEGTKTNTE